MEIHSATSDNNMATSRDLIGVNIMYFVIIEYRLMIRPPAFHHCMFEVNQQELSLNRTRRFH